MTRGLITKSAELLTQQGFTQIDSIAVEEGIHSTLFKRGGEIYLVASKKYAYQNLASFQTVQVELSSNKGVTLVFYEDRDETFHAFDPETVKTHSKLSQGRSKRADRTWMEIDLSYGVPLHDWVNGVRQDRESGQTGMEAFL